MAARSDAPQVWRAGNFVVRRRRVPTLGADDWALTDEQVRSRVFRGEIGTVEALEVSSLDGAWMTRLMPGSTMEALVSACLDDDGEAPDAEWLETVLTNLMSVSSIPNGHFHQAVLMLVAAYCDPSLLRGGLLDRRARAFRRDAARLRDAFLAWREEYDALPRDEDIDHDITAAQAEEALER